MNKRIITASAAAFVLAFAGVLKADFTQQKLGWEDFSLYASGDNVTNMEYTASQNNYTNGTYGLTGSWSSGEDFAEGEFSTIKDGGTLTLNTGGAVVTNAFIQAEADLLNGILSKGYDENGFNYAGLTNVNGDVFIKTTVLIVPSDQLENFEGEEGTSDLKFAIYAYADEDADPATTNLVVYHAFSKNGRNRLYTNETFTVEGVDFSKAVDLEVVVRRPTDESFAEFFKVTVGGKLLSSTTGCSEESLEALRANEGPWFRTVNREDDINRRLHSLNFKGTGEVSDIQVGFYGEGGSEDPQPSTPTYEVTWTAPNVGATTNGVAVSTGSSFEAGTEITFTADTGYIITGVTGYVTDTPTNSFVYVVTSSASQSLTITASAETPSKPAWYPDSSADIDSDVAAKYDAWAAGKDLSGSVAAQFLMNVGTDVANIVLRIEAIETTAEGAKITIGATGDSGDIDIVKDATEYAINGILNVSVSDTLGDWDKFDVPFESLYNPAEGPAVVLIPAAKGRFIKASVDFVKGEDGPIADTAQP